MSAMKRYSAAQSADIEAASELVSGVSDETKSSFAQFVRAVALGAELAEKQKEPA